MALFISSFINKIDKKGRVSVPSQFRLVLSEEKYSGIIVYNSFTNSSIESCGMSRLQQIYKSIDDLEPYSEERDALVTTILGSSLQLPFDPEGRVCLPEHMILQAELKDKACFVGKGSSFEIWNPEKYKEYSEQARKIAFENKKLISLKSTQVK